MKLTLHSTNHNKEHRFHLIVREKELVFVTPEGSEICSISAQTMESDGPGPATGLRVTKPTENFWLVFDAPGSQLDKNLAEAFVVEPGIA